MSDTFQAVIRSVAADFLETALVVDDEPRLPRSKAERTTEESDAGPNQSDQAGTAVGEGGAGDEPKEQGSGAPPSRVDLSLETPPVEALESAEDEHPLMAKPLIDAFADEGIVCSLLAVTESDAIRDRFLKAAARADLLVIDWELNRDGGETARNLISSIVKQDADAERKRLRVIAIYTGQPGLQVIVEQIREHLELPKEALDDTGVTLAQSNVRLTAFNKPLHEERLRPELKAREVAEEELPARLVREFASLTRGLVPAVALASLAAIRNDTHRILQALPPELDVGYLGHRVALPFPDDAEGDLTEMIVAEIGSILSENEVGQWANADTVKRWLATERAIANPLVCGTALPIDDVEFDATAMERMVEIGLGRDERLADYRQRGLKERTLRRVRKHAAHLFARDAETAMASGDLFAVRLAVRTVYTRPPRRLRLGTIVALQDKYLVCVQPRCDSVRIPPKEARGFPFLPLTKVASEPEVARSYIIEDPAVGGERVSLRLTTKPYALSIHNFAPGGQQCVEAVRDGDDWVFQDTDGTTFRWVAELKPEFAQRVAAEFGADAARIGLAESELIRLSRG